MEIPQAFGTKKVESNPTEWKIEIGGGDTRQPGYQSLICDIRKGIPLISNSVSELWLSHVLEHIEFDLTEYVLEELYRCLKPRGNLHIFVPNGRFAGVLLVLGLSRLRSVKVFMYGPQTDRWMYHKNIFTKAELREILTKAGFHVLHIKESNKGERQCGIKRYTKINLGRILSLFIKTELEVEATKE